MFAGLFGNWRTTALSVIVAVAQYLLTSGVTFPTSKKDWGSFLVGVATIAWGAVQKDSKTGSQPK